VSAVRRAAISIATGAAWFALAVAAFAASPTPGVEAGDPRSSGQGPGLVGDPLFAVLAVIVIGVTAVLVTLAWIRLTPRRDR
jgi:acetyl-CoA acetyltransferase